MHIYFSQRFQGKQIYSCLFVANYLSQLARRYEFSFLTGLSNQWKRGYIYLLIVPKAE